ncbi:MAG: hypothetical protein B7Y33_03705, partial [Hydrogenophilales bacterium 16-62-9]
MSARPAASLFSARILVLVMMAVSLVSAAPAQSQTTRITRVVSPGGIEAWLVRDTTLPLLAMEF